jgi:hypothetical protein
MQCFVYNSVILNADSPRFMKIRIAERIELYPWLTIRSRTRSSGMTCERKRKQTSEFRATDPEVPGSIPGATRFSEKSWVWNGVHSAS